VISARAALPASNKQHNNQRVVLRHTPVIGPPQHVTLHPSTEPQIATAAAITAMSTISRDITPSYTTVSTRQVRKTETALPQNS